MSVTTLLVERGARLRDLGATHILDRSGEGGPDAPAGFDVVIDVVGGPELPLVTFSSDTVPGLDRQAVRSSQFADAAHGKLRTVVHEVLPLGQAVRAHRVMDVGEVVGRVLLTP